MSLHENFTIGGPGPILVSPGLGQVGTRALELEGDVSTFFSGGWKGGSWMMMKSPGCRTHCP